MKTEQIMAQKITVNKQDLSVRSLARDTMRHTGRMLPPMPIEICFVPRNVTITYQSRDDDHWFWFNSVREEPNPKPPQLDAYKLRDAFLSAKMPLEALELLSIAGYFIEPRDDRKNDHHLKMTWSNFQRWQSVVRHMMTNGPFHIGHLTGEDHPDFLEPLSVNDRPLGWGLADPEWSWLMGYPEQIMIYNHSPFISDDAAPEVKESMVTEVIAGSIFETLMATLYVDRLSGVKYQLCALSDCRNLFEVVTKHERQYCSQACAHKASVRRRRAEAKRLKEAAAKQPTKTKAKKAKG